MCTRQNLIEAAFGGSTERLSTPPSALFRLRGARLAERSFRMDAPGINSSNPAVVDAKEGQDQPLVVVRTAAATNLCLVIMKAAAGHASHSPAMVADAYHSLFDLVADSVTYLTVQASSKVHSSSVHSRTA